MSDTSPAGLAQIQAAHDALTELVATQSRPCPGDESGPTVVLVEDIETMAAGLALALRALGAEVARPTAAPLLLPAPTWGGRARPAAAGLRKALSPEEKAEHKRAYQREWHARRKAAQQASGAAP